MQDSWQKYFAEALGTLVFVFIAAGSVLTFWQTGGSISMLGIALATGFTLTALLYSTAHISGGQLNPAVSISLWATGNMKFMTMLGNVFSQLIGSVVAALFLKVIFQDVVSPQFFLGDAMLGQGVQIGKAIFIEAILTFMLVWTIFATIIDKRGQHMFGPLCVGLVMSTAILFGGPYTSAALNPARSFGPALVSSHWATHYVYWAGPLIGALLAAFMHKYVFGKGNEK